MRMLVTFARIRPKVIDRLDWPPPTIATLSTGWPLYWRGVTQGLRREDSASSGADLNTPDQDV
ncbi:hypothetical protein CVM50_09825 [Pseudooceanicola marinus]|nr:hypothetical protein CVM50_09825 [Pseudooceanicola marinus]